MDSRETSAPPQQHQHQQHQHQHQHQHQRQQQQPSQSSLLSGMMVGHHNSNQNPYAAAAAAASMMSPNPRFPFNSVIAPPPSAASSSAASTAIDSMNSPPFDGSSPVGLRSSGFSIDSAAAGKKKRGRPRKYAPDGHIDLGLSPTTPTAIPSADRGSDLDMVPVSDPAQYHPSGKRQRGRPPGSGKKQLDALGSPGVGFTPHVITVNAGEDIASKILAFSQQGPRTVCILSANGAICNVTLRQPAMSGGTVSYEGRFEIISLSGSVLCSENDNGNNRTNGLCVSLAGPDGRVLGGGVTGMLMAATPVQVIVGSFIAEGKKSSSNLLKSGPSSAQPPQMLTFGARAAGTSPSQGGLSDSSDENGGHSPPNHGPSGGYRNATQQPIHGMPIYSSSMGWGNTTMKMLPN